MNRRLLRVALACALAQGNAFPSLADDASATSLYNQYCMVCHGTQAAGIEGLGLDLVTSAFVAGTPVPELVEFLQAGRMPNDPASVTGRPMPGFAYVSDEDLRAISEYLKDQTGESSAEGG